MVLRSYNVLRKWIFFPISPRDTLESKVKQTLNRCCRGKMFGKKRNQRSWINNNGKQDICDGDCYSTWCLKFRYTLILRSIHDTCDTRVIHAFYVANTFKKSLLGLNSFLRLVHSLYLSLSRYHFTHACETWYIYMWYIAVLDVIRSTITHRGMLPPVDRRTLVGSLVVEFMPIKCL